MLPLYRGTDFSTLAETFQSVCGGVKRLRDKVGKTKPDGSNAGHPILFLKQSTEIQTLAQNGAELDFGEIHGLALNDARLGFGAGVLYLAVVILYSLAQNDARLGFSVMPVWSDTDTYTL